MAFSPRRRPSAWYRIASGLFLVGAVLTAGCGRKAPPAKGNEAPEVVVTTPITYDVTDYQDFTGRLDAIQTVEVRPRVAGYIVEADFKEGEVVEKGTVLYRIDERPYKAVLESAKATLAGAKAQLAASEAQIAVNEANLRLARITYERARTAGRAATALELDQDRAQEQMAQANVNLARANLGNARATMSKAQADLATAQLNYDWCLVTAPVTGRISRKNIHPGNLVKADDTLLTTIVTENPIYAYFTVDERTYLNLTGHKPDALARKPHKPRRAGGVSDRSKPAVSTSSRPPKKEVLMRLANESDFLHWGSVDFTDNRLNANTGTIQLRGVFDNPNANDDPDAPPVYKPGLFVAIRLPTSKPYSALLIPDEALQSDQGRKYVYVVNKSNQVEYRSVTLGQVIPGLRAPKSSESAAAGPATPWMLRVIKKGIEPDERVMISGMQRVRDKTKVKVKVEDPPQRPADPLGRKSGVRGQESGINR